MTKQDTLTQIYGNAFMDAMHDYPSPTSNARYFHRLKAHVVFRFLQKHRGSRRLLDAGAGRGPYAFYASRFFTEVYCDEYSASELRHAEAYMSQQSINNMHFKHNDLSETDYEDNYFDAIVCSEVLEHIPARERAVRELHRILKPGGTLLISMPQKNSLFYYRVRAKHPRLRGVTDVPLDDPDWETLQHIKFTADDIIRLATISGLKLRHTYGANALPLPERVFQILYRSPMLLRLYSLIQTGCERILPRYCAFFFVELQKPTIRETNQGGDKS